MNEDVVPRSSGRINERERLAHEMQNLVVAEQITFHPANSRCRGSVGESMPPGMRVIACGWATDGLGARTTREPSNRARGPRTG